MRPVAQIAQSVEQRIENPRVGGSTPSLGTTFKLLVVAKLPEATTRNPPSACFLLPAIFAAGLAGPGLGSAATATHLPRRYGRTIITPQHRHPSALAKQQSMQVFFFKASPQIQSHLFIGLAPFNTSTNIAIKKTISPTKSHHN